MTISAQWSAKDSVWLKEVLSGERELRLTLETEKAIRSGTLLEIGEPLPTLLPVPPVLPIIKDFSEFIQPDTLSSLLDLLDLPPAVVMKYLEAVRPESGTISSGAYTPQKPLVEKESYQLPGIPVYIKASVGTLFLPEVKDGQKRGSFNGQLKYSFSLEDALRYLFWKSERDKKRNRKKAQAWKYYNTMP